MLAILLCIIFVACSSSYVTPISYGAVADGCIDCTIPIRNMLSDMKSRNIYKALFKSGQYLITDSIVIDFPCALVGRNATIVTKDTLRNRYAFVYSKSKRGKFSPNMRTTELCLNFKVHGVPVAIHGYNDIYMHDCTISTFTGTDLYYKNTKFWFAVDCDRMYDATFKRIHFDQPVNYKKNQFNSADGLHITGQCHDILIDGCDGHTGDDFIALNANEDTPGDISNVTIRNCNIGSGTISKNGIRIYGMSKKQHLKISNVLIENCRINSSNSPSVYLTNNANTSFSKDHYNIRLDSITIRNCEFSCPEFELATNQHPSAIRFAGVDGKNILIETVRATANADSLSYFINVFEQNNIENLTIRNCNFTGEKALRFIKIGRDNKSKTTVKNLVINKCDFNQSDSGFMESHIKVENYNLDGGFVK